MKNVLRIWHPPLIGLIPILSAYMVNRHEVGTHELMLPSLATVLLAASLWALFSLPGRNPARGALFASMVLFGFFQFDHLYHYILVFRSDRQIQGVFLGLLLLLGAGGWFLVVGLRRLLRRPAALQALTNWLNAFAILVIVIELAPLARDYTQSKRPPADPEAAFLVRVGAPSKDYQRRTALPTTTQPERLPDIYYIILDSYGRSDELRRLYQFDNRPFLDHLRQRGFYIAERSTTNYCQTFISLCSTLNGQYLGWLSGADQSIDSWNDACTAMRESAVLATLKQHGYKLVAFATNYQPTDLEGIADVYLSAEPPTAVKTSDFQRLLVSKTPLRLFADVKRTITGDDPFTSYRQGIRYVFDHLGRIGPEHSPKFVFAHVMAPHPPFVFGENGETVLGDDVPTYTADGTQLHRGNDTTGYVDGYRRQATYITKLAQRAIDDILDHSPQPPIILLQGDHGPGVRWTSGSADPDKTDVHERLRVLNAYYLPDGGRGALYPEISPVNSFRVVLKHYFGAKLDLLPDRSYLSSLQEPFKFVDVTARVRDAGN
jgi:hypothetical protein